MNYYYLNPIISMFKITPKYVSVYANKNTNPIMIAKINHSAYEILSLCNGSTEEMIFSKMFEKYSKNSQTEKYIHDYLENNIKLKFIIKTNKKIKPSKVITIGSKETWIPEYIAIDMTNNCPLKCKHCYLSAGEGKINYISETLLKEICNEITNLGVPMIQLTGGEPLLHPNIFETIEFLQSKDIAIQLFTSGYLNSKEIIDKLITYKNKNFIVQVSIDGLENFHNNFRGQLDAFEKSMNFIKHLTTNGVHVMVATCISTQKEEEIFQLAKLLKKMNVRLMRIGYVSNRGRANDNKITSTINTINFVRKLKNNLSKQLDSETFKIELMEDFDKLEKCGNCGLGQMTLKIDSIGDIYPCIMSNMKIGNYTKENIQAIQNKCSNLFADLQAPCNEICNNCENSILCSHCIIEAMMYCDSNKEWFKKNNPILDKIRNN